MIDRAGTPMWEALEAERQRQYRRLVAVSAAAHVLLLAFLWMGPRPGTSTQLPGVVRIDLVAALPGQAPTAALPAPSPAKAAPVPKPEPPAKPKPRPPKQKVLPEQPTAVPKPKSEPKPAPVEPKTSGKADAQADYDDLLAQLREEAGERPPVATPSHGTGGGGGGGVVVSPEVLAWMRQAKMHVRQAWVLAPGFRAEPLVTEIAVRLDARGDVRNTEVVRRSGNPWFDESVERAIRKASPLPAPPEADVWTFVFVPEDVL